MCKKFNINYVTVHSDLVSRKIFSTIDDAKLGRERYFGLRNHTVVMQVHYFVINVFIMFTFFRGIKLYLNKTESKFSPRPRANQF